MVMPFESVHESRATKLILIAAFMTSFALIAVVLRVWTRSKLTRGGLWWDDWMIVVAMAMSITHGVLLTTQIKYGIGRHEDQIPESLRDSWAKKSSHLFYAAQLVYFSMFGIIKASIILFILRLASTTHKGLRIMAQLTLAFVVLSTLACVFAGAFQCTPVAYAWDTSIPGGKCINRPAFFTANGGINIFSDAVIYILPMRTLWKVRLPVRQRVGLILVFAVGGFVVLTGILRLSTLREVSVSKDLSYDNVPSMWWTEAEFNIAIICACMPSLKPLISSRRHTPPGNHGNRCRRVSNSNFSDFELPPSNHIPSGKTSKNSTQNASGHRSSVDVDIETPASIYVPKNGRYALGRCQSPSIWLNRNTGYSARVGRGNSVSEATALTSVTVSGLDPHASVESMALEDVEAREEMERRGICKTTKITVTTTDEQEDDEGMMSDSKSGSWRSS